MSVPVHFRSAEDRQIWDPHALLSGCGSTDAWLILFLMCLRQNRPQPSRD